MRLKLRDRILFPTIGIVALLALAVSVVSFTASRNMLRQTMDKQLDQAAHADLRNVELWVDSQRQTLRVWSVDSQVADALKSTPEASKSAEQLTAMFTSAESAYGCIEAIQLVNAAGTSVAASHKETIGVVNVAERDYFKEGMAGRESISEVMPSRTTKRPVVVIATPVKVDGIVRGVIFTALDLGPFCDKFISNIKILETGYAYMYDKTGVLIAHPNKDLICKRNLDEFDWGKHILKTHNGSLDYNYEDQDLQAVFITSESLGWGFALVAPQDELHAPVRHMMMIIALVGLIALAVSIVCVLFVAQSIVRPITRATDSITAGSNQTTDAAAQVSQTSQSLAEGASEQAAAAEETSASLEEMSSISKSTSDRTKELDDMMHAVASNFQQIDVEKARLSSVMSESISASEQTARIIKTIDEIAFQTNILALNAAVEAARAGEAGAGFAVVADEVRNLAQRSAQAARDTQNLISQALEKSKESHLIFKKVEELTDSNGRVAQKVVQYVDEIATSTKELSQGIDQVNQAVSQMDKVTQSNAANAEESAAAAEELNAQALALKGAIVELQALAGTQIQEEETRQPKAARRTTQVQAPLPKREKTVQDIPMGPEPSAPERTLSKRSEPRRIGKSESKRSDKDSDFENF
jgi:methyl-accepting chemotaxis protein